MIVGGSRQTKRFPELFFGCGKLPLPEKRGAQRTMSDVGIGIKFYREPQLRTPSSAFSSISSASPSMRCSAEPVGFC